MLTGVQLHTVKSEIHTNNRFKATFQTKLHVEIPRVNFLTRLAMAYSYLRFWGLRAQKIQPINTEYIP